MPQSIKSVWVEFVSKFDVKSLKKGEKQVSKTTDSLKKMGKVLLGVFAVAKLKAWATTTITVEKNLARIARQMGVTVHEARKLQFVAESLETPMTILEDAAFEIKKRFGEIKVNKPFAALMKSLGIGTEAAAGMSSVELMLLTMDRIAKGPAKDIEKSLDLAFGGGAAKGLAGATRDAKFLQKVLEQSGGVRSTGSDGQSIQSLTAATALLKANFQVVSAELLSKILPHVIKLADWLNANLDTIIEVGLQVAKWGAILFTVVKTIMGLKALFEAVGVVIAVFTVPAWGIVAAIAAAVALLAVVVTHWDQIADKAAEVWGWMKKIASGFGGKVMEFFGIGGGGSPAHVPSGSQQRGVTNTDNSSQSNTYNINAQGLTAAQLDSQLRRNRSNQGRAGQR